MKKIVFVILLCSSYKLAGQGMMGIYLKASSPIGEFNNTVQTVPFGVAFNYQRPLKNQRFTVGGELGIAMYTAFNYNGTLPSGQAVELYEEDCFWTLHGEMRYHFYQSPAVKAYVLGRLGITTFFSSIMSNDPDVQYDEFESHGTAFNTGIGGGLLFNWNRIFHPSEEPGRTYIELGATLHSGSSASYRYVERDQNIPLDQGTFNSLTNYWDFRFGILLVGAGRNR